MKKRQIKKDRAVIAAFIHAGYNPPEKTVNRLVRDRRFLSEDEAHTTPWVDPYTGKFNLRRI